MRPAPPPPDEAARLEVLRRYGLADAPRDAALEDLARVAAQLCGAPIALVTLVEEDRQYFLARVGLDMDSTSREVSFCAHAILEPRDLMVVPDASEDERFSGNPLVVKDPKIRFYAGVPFVSPEGQPLGTLCVLDYVPRELSESQVLALRALSRGAMANVELRYAVESLADEVVRKNEPLQALEKARADLQTAIESQRKEIEQATEELRWQFEERERIETELHTKRAELREAQRLARVGSFRWSPTADRIDVSDEAYEIFGGSPETATRTLDEFMGYVHPEDRILVSESLQRLMEHRTPTELDYRIVRPDGDVRIIHTRAEAIEREGGVELAGTAQDVTERKDAEQRLQHALDRALESDRLKSAFLANVSHEIRTPLNVILGYNAVIADYLRETGAAEYQEFVTGLDRASRRLLDTMGRILDYARITSGDLGVRREPLDLVTLVQSLAREIRPFAQEKGLVLRVEIEPPKMRVSADEESLRKGLWNLLDNAVKFTKRGEVAIRLLAAPPAGPAIEIRDTGVGMSPQYLEKLFEPFSQEDVGMTRSFEGVGLGLALARRFVEMNGARLTIESRKNSGTAAHVRFPMTSPV